MQKLVTDVTYIKNKGNWYYLACYLDLFNNEIVDWELSDVFGNLLVMKPAKRIHEKSKKYRRPYPFAQRSGRPVLIGRLLQPASVLQCHSKHAKSRNSA